MYKIVKSYIFSKRDIKFINFINLLSIIGITTGVIALVVVTSLFNGLHNFTKETIFNSETHLIIKLKKGEWFEEDTSLKGKFPQLSFSPIVKRKVLLGSDQSFTPIEVVALSNNDSYLATLSKSIIVGKLDTSYGQLIVPYTLADKLNLRLNKTLNLISPNELEKIALAFQESNSNSVRLTAVYQINNKNIDLNSSFLISDNFQALFGKSTQINEIWVKVPSIESIEEYKQRLRSTIPDEFEILSFYDINKQFLDVLTLERWIGFSIIFLVVVISSFNLISSLSLTIHEKRKDIALMIAMGMTKEQVKSIFLKIGLTIGIGSNVLGLLIGLSLCYIQNTYKLIKFSGANYLIDHLPLKVELTDVLVISSLSLILVMVSSNFPLNKIFKLNIAKVLKND
jgi:lipoprotein-releasing system permease protein